MAAGMMRDRPVLAVLALFRTTRILAGLVGAGALALTVVAGAADAEEVPRSRTQIALSFAPVVREAAPAVVNIYARKGRPADPLETPPYEPAPEVSLLEGRHALPGATVANLSPGLNRDLGLNLFAAGVIVLEVERATPSVQLGLRRGDLIRTVADAPIDGVAELKDILREHPLPWRLEVERAGRRLAVVIGG
jgi:S1-C subfamily serine protease